MTVGGFDLVLWLLATCGSFVAGVVYANVRRRPPTFEAVKSDIEVLTPPERKLPPIGSVFEYCGKLFVVEGDGTVQQSEVGPYWQKEVLALSWDTLTARCFTPRQWFELLDAGRISICDAKE